MIIFGVVEVNGMSTVHRRAAELEALRAGRHEEQPQQILAVVSELIVVADELEDAAEDADIGLSDVVGRLRERIMSLLALCGVAPICDNGAVDFLRHRIIEDRPAPSDFLIDHIAETVRPGYLRGHDLLRPQLVVAYTRRVAE